MIITSAPEMMFKVRNTMNKGEENSLNRKHTEKRINFMRGIHEQGKSTMPNTLNFKTSETNERKKKAISQSTRRQTPKNQESVNVSLQ